MRQSERRPLHLFPFMNFLCFRRLAVVVCALWCVVGSTGSAQEEEWTVPTVAELRAKAAGGDVQAMVELAQRYDGGVDGAEQDWAEARAWYEKAAAKENAYAAYQIAGMFREGRGVKVDPAQAFSWMSRAADGALGIAEVELGGMYERAEGTRKNLVKALEWYLKAAEHGDADGMFLAGAAFAEGRGTKADVVEGVKWLQRAWDAGREDAGEKIGELREADPGLDAKLLAASPEVQQLTAKGEAGNVEAQVALAKKLQWGGDGIFSDDVAALGWWRKAAEQGNAEAEAEMGMRYVTGMGVEADLEEAKTWLEKAAAKKRPEAFFWLGAMNDEYAPGERNPTEAARYYRLAAELGYRDAQKRLGQFLEAGEGVEQNLADALTWYLKAAEQGDPRAMIHVGMLASGEERSVRDLALARTWLEKARGLGVMDAQFLLEDVTAAAEREQLAKDMPSHVPEALREMYVEALRGDNWSQWQIAERYSKGQDGMPKDEAAFEMWRERAATAGRLEAQESLGLALTDPASPKRDVAKGRPHLEQAATAGLNAARFRLAELLAAGDGVEQNESWAAELFEAEARVSNREAMWRLRQMYARGIAGAAPDQAKAAEWLMRASIAGHSEAKAEEAKVAAATAAEAKAAEEAKFAEVQRKLDADFAASISLAEREKAVREYSRTIAQLDWGNGQNQVRISERVFRALIPKMQERVNEAGAYAMAVDSLAFEPAVMNRVVPANLLTAIRAHGQQISAAFNAGQQALGPIQSLIPGAEAGDVAKQMQIADYLMQKHAAHNPEGAVRWYKRAADAGHAPARQKIASATAEMLNRARTAWHAGRSEEAIALGKKVAELGSAEAMLFLGATYIDGKKMPLNLEEAKTWFLAAKAAGHPNAQEGLDLIAQRGQPGAAGFFAAGMAAYQEKKFSDALAAWEKAAEAGHPDALFNLGVLYERGEGTAKDNAKALAWFERAAAKQAKNAEAAVRRVKTNIPFERGYAAYEAKRFEEAAAAWKEAAELGSMGAMYNLGVIHEKGEGVALNLPQAMTWFEKAAAGGHKDSEAAVARLKPKLVAWDIYSKGVAAEEETDFEAALPWFEQAAAAGNTSAMIALGRFHEEGLGVDENPHKAMEWYEKAAESGDSEGEMRADLLHPSLEMYDLMASQREMKRLRDQIDGVASGNAPAAATGSASGKTAKQLRKNRPWTPEEVRAALREGADHRALSHAIKADKLEQTFTDLELRRLLNTPEGQRVEDFSPLSRTLHENVYQGAGAWTYEMAKAAVEARRAQVGRVAKVVDSAELRAKAAAGEAAALVELYAMPEEQRTQGAITVNRDEVARRVEEQSYARGYWIVADTLRHNPDKTKNDPVRRAELLFRGAEAGDPRAMRELAMELIAPGETAVAVNYADAEYWMIEAAARAAEGTMEDPYLNPGRDVVFFYSFSKTTGGPTAWPLSNADEPTLRWAREMIRRGGKLAEVANVHLDAFELEARTKGVRAKLAALAPEVAPWSAVELAKLEAAAKAGDAEAALKLGNGYATGRGVRQWDGKAVAYYELAAAKGRVPAMRALAEHYFKGFGVLKDGAKRLAWLEKAGEAGDVSAWTAAANLLHYGVQDPKTEQDFPRAIVLYQKAVAKGHGPAMHALGVMHQNGRGVAVDKLKAVEWYRKAAEAGESFSMVMLGNLFKEEQKWAAAAEWFGKAGDAGEEHGRFWQAQMLARAGERARAIVAYREVVAKAPRNSRAWLELGAELQDSSAFPEAKEAYRKVIELVGVGDRDGELAKKLLGEIEAREAPKPAATAMATTAAAPTNGRTADQLLDLATQAALQDKGREVVRLIQAAAANGETASAWNRHRLALMLMHGMHGVPKNEARARELLKSAAEGGYGSARLDYALALVQGALGFAAEPERGRALLVELAADAENVNPEAKHQIGMLLYQGTMLPLDKARGIKLVNAAADWGVGPAQFEIGRALITGLPELPADPVRGVEYLKRAAASGVPAGAAVLGEIYEKGFPVAADGKPVIAADAKEALKWYEAAQKAGIQQVAPAIERLQLQLSGKGPPPEKK